MMNQEQLKKYLEGAINDIRTLYVTYQKKFDELEHEGHAEYTMMGIYQIHLSDEQQRQRAEQARNIGNQLMEEYRDAEKKAVEEVETFLAELKKEAVQELTAAEPVPTENQLTMIDMIRREYTVPEGAALDMVKARKFEQELNFHVDNETVKAFPYWCVAKEIFPETESSAAILNDMYDRIFPDVAEKRKQLEMIEHHERWFKAAVIGHKMDTMTRETEVDNLEIIRMKSELFDLGYGAEANKHDRVITYIQGENVKEATTN